MTDAHSDYVALAQFLDRAMLERREVPKLTEKRKLSLEEAYRIQDEGLRLRSSRGEKIIGYKMGLTSKAKMEQMGLRQPIYGVLTDAMRVSGKFALNGSIHPKIEPEIALFVARELKGPVTPQEALAACSGVCAAMEILDSRYVGFKYFSLEDVVADNSSSAYFVLANQWTPTAGKSVDDFAGLKMRFLLNGELKFEALSSEILGNPILSLAKLCELLDSRGLSLPAGSIVLTGAATQAIPLENGQNVALEVTDLPRVGIQIG